MRIATLVLAASLALALNSATSARGATGYAPMDSYAGEFGNASPRDIEVFRIAPGFGANGNPAGVMDGTNPNPNPTEAGGILSPDGIANW